MAIIMVECECHQIQCGSEWWGRRKEEGGRRKEEEEGDSWDQSIKWHVTQVTTGRAVIRVEEDGLPEDRRCCFRVGSVVAMARCTSIETFLSADWPRLTSFSTPVSIRRDTLRAIRCTSGNYKHNQHRLTLIAAVGTHTHTHTHTQDPPLHFSVSQRANKTPYLATLLLCLRPLRMPRNTIQTHKHGQYSLNQLNRSGGGPRYIFQAQQKFLIRQSIMFIERRVGRC